MTIKVDLEKISNLDVVAAEFQKWLDEHPYQQNEPEALSISRQIFTSYVDLHASFTAILTAYENGEDLEYINAEPHEPDIYADVLHTMEKPKYLH